MQIIIDTTSEPMTLKTCRYYEHWEADLGGNKMYKCSCCSICLDRDENGVSGIWCVACRKAVDVEANIIGQCFLGLRLTSVRISGLMSSTAQKGIVQPGPNESSV